VVLKCKSIVLHELGRILGLFREVSTILLINYFFQQINPSLKFKLNSDKVIDFYKKNIVHINKENNERQSEIEIMK
jgi:hypothetical protein